MDFTITITKTLLGSIVLAILAYGVKGLITEKFAEMAARRQAFLSHIDLCTEKSKAFALLEQRVSTLEHDNVSDRATREWIGDCVVKIATKMDVELDPRPRA